MTRTVDDVIREYKVLFDRIAYAGNRPFDDELLVAEIERLRQENEQIRMIHDQIKFEWKDLQSEIEQFRNQMNAFLQEEQ